MDVPGRYEVAFDGLLHDVTSRARPDTTRTPRGIDCGTAVVVVASR
jgi:hypothetical protein